MQLCYFRQEGMSAHHHRRIPPTRNSKVTRGWTEFLTSLSVFSLSPATYILISLFFNIWRTKHTPFWSCCLQGAVQRLFYVTDCGISVSQTLTHQLTSRQTGDRLNGVNSQVSSFSMLPHTLTHLAYLSYLLFLWFKLCCGIVLFYLFIYLFYIDSQKSGESTPGQKTSQYFSFQSVWNTYFYVFHLTSARLSKGNVMFVLGKLDDSHTET